MLLHPGEGPSKGLLRDCENDESSASLVIIIEMCGSSSSHMVNTTLDQSKNLIITSCHCSRLSTGRIILILCN